MEIGMFFSVLDPENARKLGKFAKFLFRGALTEKKFKDNG